MLLEYMHQHFLKYDLVSVVLILDFESLSALRNFMSNFLQNMGVNLL